jgi:truncated hemoglobin YjbI
MQELEVYSMIGTEGFTRLVAAFYRQIPQDDLLRPINALDHYLSI